jgi:hypothetical protein
MGHALHDFGEGFVAADRVKLAALGEFGGEGQAIDRLAEIVEVADRPVEGLVGVAVEVVHLQFGDDVMEDLVVEQDAPEDPLLRFEVLRRKPVDQRALFHLRRAAVSTTIPIPFEI